MKQKFYLILLLCFGLLNQSSSLASENQLLFDSSLKKFAAQQVLIDQAQAFLKQLKFDEAIKKYEEACQPQYLTKEGDKWWPYVWLAQALFYQGEIEKAMQLNNWFLLSAKQNQKIPLENKAKFQAILEYKKKLDKTPVYLFIEQYKKTHINDIPPKRADQLVMSRIAELYDLIGDYDAGIQWAKKFRKADKSEPLKRTRKEYDQLIQAFEESKQGMPKVCSEDGKYCVGRATAVIIRSGYF